MSGSWVRMDVRGRETTSGPTLMSCCLAIVLGLTGLGCRAVVGIESRSEAVDADLDGVDASLDADASVDDASVDASVDADTGSEACSPCDGGTEAEAGPELCNAMQTKHLFDVPDSGLPPLGPAYSGPRMARLDGTWSMVWVGDNHQSIAQVSIKDNGDDLRLAPLVVAPAGVKFADPRVDASDDRMILGLSRTTATGDHAVELYTFDPLTGMVLDGAVTLAADPAEAPLVLSGIASAPGKNRFLTVTRQADSGGVAGPVSVHLYQADPLEHLDERVLNVDAFHAAVAWSEAAQRFGVAYLDTSLMTRGWFALFDLQVGQTVLTAPAAPSEFTSGPDWPLADAGPFELSVTAGGDDFVVAWLDRQDAPGGSGYPEDNLDVYAVSVDPATGLSSPPNGVKVSGEKSTRRFVSVVHDGTSFLVAWLEKDASDFAIRARRLDSTLQPVGGIVEVGETDEAFLGPFGTAAAAQRDYGFASISSGSELHFNRIVCIDP